MGKLNNKKEHRNNREFNKTNRVSPWYSTKFNLYYGQKDIVWKIKSQYANKPKHWVKVLIVTYTSCAGISVWFNKNCASYYNILLFTKVQKQKRGSITLYFYVVCMSLRKRQQNSKLNNFVLDFFQTDALNVEQLD